MISLCPDVLQVTIHSLHALWILLVVCGRVGLLFPAVRLQGILRLAVYVMCGTMRPLHWLDVYIGNSHSRSC